MHLVYPTSFYKWDIYDSYSYTRPVRAIYDLYKSALALRVLFYFLRSLYVCSSPYLIRDTHYRLINILLLGYYCVSHIRITWLYQHQGTLKLGAIAIEIAYTSAIAFVLIGMPRANHVTTRNARDLFILNKPSVFFYTLLLLYL